VNKAEQTRELILHAAIEEFAHVGYTNATTSGIAHRAGISKGLIFYHYASKKALLLAALEYGVGFFERYLFANPEFTQISDIFERIMFIGRMKQGFYKEYHTLNAVIIDAYRLVGDAEFQDVREYFNKVITSSVPKFFEGVDTSKFRGRVSPQETVSYIIDVMTLISMRHFAKFKEDPNAIYGNIQEQQDNVEAFVDLIKYGVYAD